MTIEEARSHIGALVAYTPQHGDGETGMITSVTDDQVFVRYGRDQHSKATRPEDLQLAGNAQ